MNMELLNAMGYAEMGTYLIIKPHYTTEQSLAGQVWYKTAANQWQNGKNNVKVAGSILARAYIDEVWWMS